MNLTATEKAQIRQLISSPQWRTIEVVASYLCQKWKDDSVVRDSEWETLKVALMNEGSDRGIKLFMQELINSTQDAT